MFDLTVKPDNGEAYELTAESRDIYTWEKTGKNRSVGSIMDNLSMQALFEIAHIAAKRTGKFKGTLDEFVELNNVEFDVKTDDLDPTLLDRLRAVRSR